MWVFNIKEAPIHPLRARLWESLIKIEGEKAYVPDRDRQKKVFESINWETFLNEIASESKGSGEGGKRQLRGKIFEMLVAADPEFGERSPLEKELFFGA